MKVWVMFAIYMCPSSIYCLMDSTASIYSDFEKGDLNTGLLPSSTLATTSVPQGL
jgi:hypothetical protein